ncbi:hypothetical protein Bbelb_442600 [Branchiostoma belcheri]|nr:hypothetical protein Bbelb_442600 [Branchiostoma belcheri]
MIRHDGGRGVYSGNPVGIRGQTAEVSVCRAPLQTPVNRPDLGRHRYFCSLKVLNLRLKVVHLGSALLRDVQGKDGSSHCLPAGYLSRRPDKYYTGLKPRNFTLFALTLIACLRTQGSVCLTPVLGECTNCVDRAAGGLSEKGLTFHRRGPRSVSRFLHGPETSLNREGVRTVPAD